MISVGDIMMPSPATLTSIPRFWHSCPKIAPTPEKKVSWDKYTDFSFQNSKRFSLSFGSKMVTSMSILEHDW
jgi:hypothetical protein